MPLNIVVLSYPISVLVFTQVFIVQAITTRQSNQANNSQTTTTNHQTTSSQFKATTTTSTKLIANEYFVDQGKNFTSHCPVTDTKMVTFWYRELPAPSSPATGDSSGLPKEAPGGFVDHTIHWDKQIHRELRLTKVNEQDTGIYTCAVIRGYDGYADRFDNASDRSLWTVLGAERNEERARILLDSLESSLSGRDNLSMLAVAGLKTIKVRVRTVPAAVSQLSVRASTIIAVLIWAYPPKELSFYMVRSFTAEFRRQPSTSENDSEIWERLDPINISPNIRQLEVYHLKPNETYDFQIWANNQHGPGEIRMVSATTKSQYEEKDLIRLIMKDAKNFDTRAWIVAVGIVLGAFVVLSLGICIVLYKEWQEEDEDDSPVTGEQSGRVLDRVELVPNIILNPGFCDSDDQEIFSSPFIKRYNIQYQPTRHPDSPRNSDDEYSSDEQSEIIPFKRKLSIFFTEGTIKRI